MGEAIQLDSVERAIKEIAAGRAVGGGARPGRGEAGGPK
jgi:hypothetical protein